MQHCLQPVVSTTCNLCLLQVPEEKPGNIELPDACFIRKLNQNEMPWAPLLYENFFRDYKVKELCGIYGPAVPLLFFSAGGGASNYPNASPSPRAKAPLLTFQKLHLGFQMMVEA